MEKLEEEVGGRSREAGHKVAEWHRPGSRASGFSCVFEESCRLFEQWREVRNNDFWRASTSEWKRKSWEGKPESLSAGPNAMAWSVVAVNIGRNL